MPMGRPSSLYRPTALTPGVARLCNVLASRAALAGGGALSFHFEPEPRGGTVAASLCLEVGGFIWRLEFLDLDFLRATNEALTETEILSLPEDLRQALLLFFLHPYLERLEKALDTPIHPLPTQNGANAAAGDATPFFFTLALAPEHTVDKEARRLPLRLGVSSGKGASWLAGRIAAAFPQTRRCPEWAGWHLPLTLEAGRMRVPIGLVRELALADILLPQHYPAKEGKLALFLPSGAGFCLDVSDGRAVVTDSYRNQETLVAAPDPNARTALDALEVTIHFELTKKLLPLTEIETLAPGRTFPLSTDPMSAVTLTMEGQALATARLVDLGGILGVQVTRLLQPPKPKPEAS
ncbi:MAG: FliM/FliN family flagellar motor switch protein [Candidatus Accumulibacter sp.]|jgi:type III secretion protein Q|nr:FliM/FliN family flagellar motor switch protein [Accumulibacter sp.]